MRTIRCSGCLRGGGLSAYGGVCPGVGCLPRGVSAWGWVCAGGVCPGGICLAGVTAWGCLPGDVCLRGRCHLSPWTEWQTGVKTLNKNIKNITKCNESHVIWTIVKRILLHISVEFETKLTRSPPFLIKTFDFYQYLNCDTEIIASLYYCLCSY